MTTAYKIVPIPVWSFFDSVGRPVGGGQLFSFKDNDRTQPKAIYQNAGGTLTYPNPIQFDNNGAAPDPHLFFFADDELYYLRFTTPPLPGNPPGSEGDLIWDVEGFGPSIAGGGGSGPITTNILVENLIVNNVFNYNIGATANPIGATDVVLAPGAHDIYKPDIRFLKNNTAATDQITFGQFYPTQPNALGSGDITPEYYLQYACSNSPGGESQKCVQFPICKHVQNLNNQEVTISFWGKGVSGTQQLQVFVYQDFGNGGAPSVVAPILVTTFNLTTSWALYRTTYTIPNISGLTVGTVGNDGLYLQIGFPQGVPTTVQFTKPCVFIGNFTSALGPTFDTYDQIDAQTNSPRTGDIRISMNDFAPFGWVGMNDGTIGNASSNATARANLDTFQLFSKLWSAMFSNQSYAPMYTSTGASIAYGADAITDFDANRQLSLPKALGQVFAGTSTAPSAISYTADFTTGLLTVSSSISMGTGVPVVLAGGTPPNGLTNGTIYYAINVSSTTIKLASSIANALSGTALAFTDNGTGPFTIQVKANILGFYRGEENHTLISSELPDPLTAKAFTTNCGSGGSGVVSAGGASVGDATVRNVGGNNGHNTMQPTTYMNVFIKL